MLQWLSKLDVDNVISLIGIVGAAIAFCVALMQYRSTQRWKKAEFFVAEYKKFFDDPYIQKAGLMLDGYTICLNVPKGEIDGITDNIQFHPAKLIEALTPMSSPLDEAIRKPELVYIRICIDKFLFRLGIFNHYLKNNFITKKEAENYFLYWVKLIGDKSNEASLSKEARSLLHQFLIAYNYRETIELIERFENYRIG